MFSNELIPSILIHLLGYQNSFSNNIDIDHPDIILILRINSINTDAVAELELFIRGGQN